MDMWNKRANAHKDGQEKNPFGSGAGGGKPVGKLSKNDANYGKAAAGSKTEARAKQAQAWVIKEIDKLIGVINEIGEKDDEGRVCVKFGPLFYAYQVRTVTLQRARRWLRRDDGGVQLRDFCLDEN